jgi:hypothetical protein
VASFVSWVVMRGIMMRMFNWSQLDGFD